MMIQTDMGWRAYAEKELRGVFSTTGTLADGSELADGTVQAGCGIVTALEKSGRVLDFGNFERSITPKSGSILAIFTGKQQQNVSVDLDNADLHFSKLLAKEPFLSKTMVIKIGFEDMPQADHFNVFSGVISEVEITPDRCKLQADEQ